MAPPGGVEKLNPKWLRVAVTLPTGLLTEGDEAELERRRAVRADHRERLGRRGELAEGEDGAARLAARIMAAREPKTYRASAAG